MKNNLQHFRKLRGITQTELAEQLGVKRPVISRYETGDVEFTFEQAVKMANILGLPVGALVEEDTTVLDEMIGTEKAMETIICAYNGPDGNITHEQIAFLEADLIQAQSELHRLKREAGIPLTQRTQTIENEQLSRLLRYAEAAEKAKQESIERFQRLYEQLNATGKRIALERVEELTKIPDYQNTEAK